MDFIRDDIRTLYFKFLLPSMASAIVMSIYSFVDAIAVGQSEGASGTAAMAVIAPVYGVIVFLSLLCGIGGSVMMSMAKGEGNEEKGNACFTVSVLCMSILTGIAWAVFLLFREQIFTLFGANAEIMPKTVEYGRWLVWFLPAFIFPIFIGAFIRNDGAPKLAMAAVIIGGCVNIFGDWFFVFPLVKRDNISYNISLPVRRAIFLQVLKKPCFMGFPVHFIFLCSKLNTHTVVEIFQTHSWRRSYRYTRTPFEIHKARRNNR